MSLSRLSDWLASTTTGVIRPGASVSGRAVDMAFRRALILSKLFTKSWGHPLTLKQLVEHHQQIVSQRLIPEFARDCKIKMVTNRDVSSKGVRVIDATFRSPHAMKFPNQMPGPLQWAHWRGILPAKGRKRGGLCIHLAGTGDHSYYRREKGFAEDLLATHGIASILIQNPYYTDRKPESQFRSQLDNVSDLFVMGAALMVECAVLLQWAQKEGFWPLGLSGVSMGGFMASLAATTAPCPTVTVPILSWTSAAPSYTEGAIAGAINYPALEQLLEDRSYMDKLNAIHDVTWIEDMNREMEINGKGKAYNMMRVLMDYFTSLEGYPTPMNTELCRAIVAEDDAYVLRTHGSPKFTDVWPGMELDVMPGVGHVQAYVFGHAKFREAIAQKMLQAKLSR